MLFLCSSNLTYFHRSVCIIYNNWFSLFQHLGCHFLTFPHCSQRVLIDANMIAEIVLRKGRLPRSGRSDEKDYFLSNMREYECFRLFDIYLSEYIGLKMIYNSPRTIVLHTSHWDGFWIKYYRRIGKRNGWEKSCSLEEGFRVVNWDITILRKVSITHLFGPSY